MGSQLSSIESTTLETYKTQGVATTFVLCFFITLFEGYDLSAAGVVAPQFGRALSLSHGQVGLVFTAATIGLFFGAILGGWAADRVGRKLVLTVSLVAFGLFSVGTSLAGGFETMVLMRILTGLGIGGALPTVIAIVAENSPLAYRQKRVTLVSAAIPIGGLVAVLLVLAGSADLGWRAIFQIGGWPPLALSLFVLFFLPETPVFLSIKETLAADPARTARSRSAAKALLGPGQAVQTLLLWMSFFFTSVVIYLMVNWLPTLLVAKGFSPRDASLGILAFALGSTVGAIAFGLVTMSAPRLSFLSIYIASAIGLVGLFLGGSNFGVTLSAAFCVGLFAIGGQFLLYGVSSTIYPDAVRGTGVGWAVAIGRVGAIVGPALGGVVMSWSGNPSTVIAAALPPVLLALVGSVALTRRRAPAS